MVRGGGTSSGGARALPPALCSSSRSNRGRRWWWCRCHLNFCGTRHEATRRRKPLLPPLDGQSERYGLRRGRDGGGWGRGGGDDGVRRRRRRLRGRGEEAAAERGAGARPGAELRGGEQAGAGAQGAAGARPRPAAAPGRGLVPEPPGALEDQAARARLQRAAPLVRRAPPRPRRAPPRQGSPPRRDQGSEGEAGGRGGSGQLHVGEGGAGGVRRPTACGHGVIRQRLQRGAERHGRDRRHANRGGAGSGSGDGDAARRRGGGGGERADVLAREFLEGGGGRDGVPGRRGAVRGVLRRRAAAGVVDRADGSLEMRRGRERLGGR